MPEKQERPKPLSAICKFRCESVTKTTYGETPKLVAQYDQDLEEDRRFSKATPSGTLEASISNENVFGFFQPGKCYYLTVTPAD